MPNLFPSTNDILIKVLSFFNRPQLEQYALVNQQFNNTICTYLNRQPCRLLYRVDIHTTKVGLVLSYDTTKCLPYLHYERKGAPPVILPYLAAKCIRAQNLTLWISPIEFSTSREETIPELVNMVEQLAHIWKNSASVSINSCLYVEEQVQMLEDLLLGLQLSSKDLVHGKKELNGSLMGLEFSGSYSLLLFRNTGIFSALFCWDQIELSGLENCEGIKGLAKYLSWIPAKGFLSKEQYIQIVFCFLDSRDEEEKHKDQRFFKEFMLTLEKDFLSSTHIRTYKLHIDCFFGHEEAFAKTVQCFQPKSLANVTTNECLHIRCDRNYSVKIERK